MGTELQLLALALLASLLMIPLGLPGTFLMVASGIAFNALVPGDRLGPMTIVATTIVAIGAEGLDLWASAHFNRRYGGSRRAGWGAIAGGIAGAIVGVPVPIVGSVVGAFAGAFVGALLLEYTKGRDAGASTRVATGALLARVASAAMKVGVGAVLAVWILAAAWN